MAYECECECECGYKMNEQTNDGTHTHHTHAYSRSRHTRIHIKRFKVSHTYTKAHISWRASQRIRSITTIKFKTHTKWCEWRCEWRRRRRRRRRTRRTSRKMKERTSRVENVVVQATRPEFHWHNGKRASERAMNREKIKMKIYCSSVVPLCVLLVYVWFCKKK